MSIIMIMIIPLEIKRIAEKLVKKKFQAYLVGGCVRDILLNKTPKDWDIATDAKPEEIQKIFPESVYENAFGTVAVKTDSENESLKIVEITTFRKEGKYTDKRHPDSISFAKSIEEDLARRDFTINAIAMNLTNDKRQTTNDKLIDPFDGQKDLDKKLIRTVGSPEDRFNEDALRLIRAVRLAAELDFEIEKETAKAVKEDVGLLEMIAKERIRDEFIKMIMCDNAAKGVILLEDLGLLRYIAPELREGIGVGQNKHHIYTIFDHNVRSLDYAVQKKYPLEIRAAALFHDLGKPKTKRGEGPDSTFYNHEIAGAKMTYRLLERLKFPKEIRDKIVHLVRYHLFYYNVGEVTAAGVRRFLNRVGPENVDDLMKVREADRIGSGVPKAVPYKLRHLMFMIEKVKQDPISAKMLAVDGNAVMKTAGIEPGPKVGWILSNLLDEVLEEPEKNQKEILKTRIKELAKLSDKELKSLSEKARQRKEEFEGGLEEEMKKRFYIK